MSLFQAFARFKSNFVERRRSLRVQVQIPAWIDCGDGSQPRNATIVDLSDDGARITVASTADLPKKFWVALAKDKTKRRYCRVVFRSETQVGVQFLSANQSDFFAPTMN